MASTYSQGTTGSAAELYALSPVASAWLNSRDDFIAMAASSHLAVGDDTAAVVHYDLENAESDNADGRRGVGSPEPVAEGGSLQTRSVTLYDWGKEVILDPNDPSLRGQDPDTIGAQRGASKLADVLERRMGGLIASSTTPWTLADAGVGATWKTATTDILGDLVDNLVLFDAQNSLVSHRPNAMAVSREAWLNLRMNTAMNSGGVDRVGINSDQAALAALNGIGITHVFVGPTSIYAGYVNIFYYSDNPVVSPGGIVFAHKGMSGEAATVSRVQRGHRRVGYYVYTCGGYVVIPEYGFRLTGATA